MPSRPPFSPQTTSTTFLSTTTVTGFSTFDHDRDHDHRRPHSDRTHSYTSTGLTSPQSSSSEQCKDHLDVSDSTVSIKREQKGQVTVQKMAIRTVTAMQELETPNPAMAMPRRISLDLVRGPSVKDRASRFEQSTSQAVPSSSRNQAQLHSQSQSRPRSTSPLRISRPGPSSTTNNPESTPSRPRRVPVPSTAPIERTAYYSNLPSPRDAYQANPIATPPELKRGKGSARRMIQAWETGSSTPRSLPSLPPPVSAGARMMTARTLSREYLDQKPLPLPRATPLPSSSAYSPAQSSPYPAAAAGRGGYNPSPLQNYSQSPYHLQTPQAGPSRKRSNSNDLSPAPSSYSLSPSPSGEKRRKGKSPLKDILNVFGGGIQALGRKAKGKGKSLGMQKSASRDSFGNGYGFRNDAPWSEGMDRVGTNGLPGGIVYSDRMGDQEMREPASYAANAIRASAMLYLIPTPCSSVSPWGSWLTSWGALDSQSLRVTYCPVFHNPQSGSSTPRRVLSGTYNPSSSALSVPFHTIPPPEAGVSPDVDLPMQDCVEVKSLRKEEVKARGIPLVPEGVGTEVLELVWVDGTKRYIGVEGVGGRIGWVSAIWDVLLACKPQQEQPLSQPEPAPASSPNRMAVPHIDHPTSSLASFPYPDQRRPAPELSTFQTRIAHIEARSAPPIQKIGDTWVASGALGSNCSDVTPVTPADGSAYALRNSVKRMFEAGPDSDVFGSPQPGTGTATSRRESETHERIKAWQPKTEHDLSIFSRNNSRRSAASAIPLPGGGGGGGGGGNGGESDPYQHHSSDGDGEYRATDTLLSFDPNDLNPSRSASQVRRASTIIATNDQAQTTTAAASNRRRAVQTGTGYMPVLDERSDDGFASAPKSSTHISHVTFPKPTLGGSPFPPNGSGNSSGNGNGLVSQVPSLPTISSGSNSSCETTEDGTIMQTPRTGQTALSTACTSLDHTVIAKLDTHSNEHCQLAKQVDGVQIDLARAITTLTTLVTQSRTATDDPIPMALDDKLTSISLDVKGIENALQLSNLAASRQGQTEPQLPDIHLKLDAIAKLCEDVLAKHTSGNINGKSGGAETEIDGLPLRSSRVGADHTSGANEHSGVGSGNKGKKESLSLIVENDEVKKAGEEVAQIMAELTGGSTKASPRLGGIQVLHGGSAPNSPRPSTIKPAPLASDEVTKQVGEVLGLVKELRDARSIQTQQTTDMARYLNELNAWLEKFVANSTTELNAMNSRLTSLVGEVASEDKPAVPGLPDLVADVHSMLSDQKRRNEAEGMVGQRLDGLLTMMGEERERMAGQQSTVEHVLQILEKQRQDNEVLLRAVATDLTAEIRGERIRFVEAMQQATTVNVNLHVEEFKKILGSEVSRAMSELGRVREEKRALEQQISDLFALKAKHAPGESRKNSRNNGPPMAMMAGPPSAPGSSVGTPGAMGRGLPLAPTR